jgi:hypothetical protein
MKKEKILMPITFAVNLQTPYDVLAVSPYGLNSTAVSVATRSTSFPDLYLGDRLLKHGDTFDVSGPNAVYLRSNYTTGVFKILDVVSGTP